MTGRTAAVLMRQKPLWNVLFSRNINFIGRQNHITSIYNEFRIDDEKSRSVQAITGMGGVGKTQLCVEYAYQHKEEYSLVWWINGQDTSTITAEYVSLASELGLAIMDIHDTSVVVESIRGWLASSTGWLLIFDDVQEPSILTRFIPFHLSGHILVTSRNPSWKAYASCQPIEVLPRTDSIEFLDKRIAVSDKSVANELAATLGDLPLALEQAGAYMERTGIGIDEYLVRFRQHEAKLLKRGVPAHYERTVATTWELSLQQVKSRCPVAIAYITMCSFLSSDLIHREMFDPCSEKLPPDLCAAILDPLEYDEMVTSLKGFSLIQVIPSGGFSIHPLVQTVIRNQVTCEDRTMWLEALATILFTNISGELKRNVGLLPHALSVVGYSKESDIDRETFYYLYYSIGDVLHHIGDWKNARHYVETCVQLAADTFGWTHDTYVRSQVRCAGFLTLVGEYNLALDHATKADEALQTMGDEVNHPELYLVMGNLLRKLGKIDDALRVVEKAQNIITARGDVSDSVKATLMASLGEALAIKGNLRDSRQYFDKALKLVSANDGQYHVRATILDIWGEVCRSVGDYETSRRVAREALTVMRKELGDGDHLEFATCFNNLGLSQYYCGQTDVALNCFKRALKIEMNISGEKSTRISSIYSNLGMVHEQSDTERALEYYRMALEIDLNAYGEIHPSIAVRLNNIGNVYSKKGLFDEAETCLSRAVNIDEQVYGPDHLEVAKDLSNLGVLLWDRSEYERAKPILERVHVILQRHIVEWGLIPGFVVEPEIAFCCVLYHLNERHDAERYFEALLKTLISTYGFDNQHVGKAVNNFCTTVVITRNHVTPAVKRILSRCGLHVDTREKPIRIEPII